VGGWCRWEMNSSASRHSRDCTHGTARNGHPRTVTHLVTMVTKKEQIVEDGASARGCCQQGTPGTPLAHP